MWQVEKLARPRRKRSWLVAAALIPTIVFGLSACGTHAPAQPQVITDKGTPYGDLLVPKLTASVKDCKGNTADVPGDKVKAPGSHEISGQSDAWAVLVMPEDYPGLELGKGCKTWTVTTHAEWDKGKWDQAGAVEMD